MKNYRFVFEKYKGMRTFYTCPKCGKHKVYTRYIDTKTGEYLPFKYGRCQRLNNCAYHLNPYQDGYFKTIFKAENENIDHWKKNISSPINQPKPKQIFFPFDIFERSLSNYSNNNFINFLRQRFGKKITLDLINRFYIGTSNYWNGTTVFWLIDIDFRIVGGQVICFNENGQTKKINLPNGRKFRFNSWVHKALHKSYKEKEKQIPYWLQKYIANSPKFPSLFGLHQLRKEPYNKPIAIVEAAKTAIIASVYLPQYIWLAVGSLSYLNKDRLIPLLGRNITLFPDNGGFERWSKVIHKLEYLANFTISNLLENKGENGNDLADYLLQFDLKEFNEANEKHEIKLARQLLYLMDELKISEKEAEIIYDENLSEQSNNIKSFSNKEGNFFKEITQDKIILFACYSSIEQHNKGNDPIKYVSIKTALANRINQTQSQ